jgi:hypothetical protein
MSTLNYFYLILKNIWNGKALGKLGNTVAETLFPANVSPCFPRWANTRKQCFRNKNRTGKHEMFLNLIGNISASREVNCVSATMFPRVGKHRNT